LFLSNRFRLLRHQKNAAIQEDTAKIATRPATTETAIRVLEMLFEVEYARMPQRHTKVVASVGPAGATSAEMYMLV
jgi:hypothetical protein